MFGLGNTVRRTNHFTVRAIHKPDPVVLERPSHPAAAVPRYESDEDDDQTIQRPRRKKGVLPGEMLLKQLKRERIRERALNAVQFDEEPDIEGLADLTLTNT